MTKKIFGSIAIVAAIIFVASIALVMGVLYNHFQDVQVEQMKIQTELVQQGIEKSGASFTDGLKTEGCRLTWIDDKGRVLYDSAAEAATMENHLEREEVKEAIKTGEGKSSRYSTTLMEKQLYVTKKAADGSVIRISDTQRSFLGIILGMLQQILIVAAVALVLSVFLAYRLTKKIVRPLNNIDPDHPDKEAVYEELQPLLDRIISQQNHIVTQSRKLTQKQKELDASTADMDEGLLIINDERQIISINKAAAEILGASQNMRNRSLSDLDADEEITIAFEKTLTGESTQREMRIGDRQFQIHASPVLSSGKTTAVVIFLLDVSADKKTEQMRREFTANVSHELKTPLQTIRGSAELISEGMVREEDVPEFGRKIYRESNRLIDLIDDIIGLSRLDEGAEDMKMEQVDMLAVAEHAVAGLSQTAAGSGVGVRITGGSAMVRGDFAMLRSIVHNLCENAIKYSERGSEVTVDVESSDDEVCLTVEDNGIGIPEEDQERIFERFYRVDKGRSKEIGGTGLGLSIVKHAVTLHEGRIELESKPGEGTRVRVFLPVEGN